PGLGGCYQRLRCGVLTAKSGSSGHFAPPVVLGLLGARSTTPSASAARPHSSASAGRAHRDDPSRKPGWRARSGSYSAAPPPLALAWYMATSAARKRVERSWPWSG